MIEELKSPIDILQESIDLHDRDSFYVGFSGGKDSTVVADMVATLFPKQFKGLVYCDTTIGTDETLEFVKEYCKQRDWKLNVLTPKKSFEQIVKDVGFPKAGGHNITMRYLKYAPLRKFILGRRKNHGEQPCVISGVRQDESKRRSVNASKEIYRDGNLYFISPVLYKSDEWMYEYYVKKGLRRSPVYDTLHISGDCLCGCFAKSGELEIINIFHKKLFQKIKYLTWLIKDRTDIADKYKTWGNKNDANVIPKDDLEQLTCNECYNDRDHEADGKKYIEEIDKIDMKLGVIMNDKD